MIAVPSSFVAVLGGDAELANVNLVAKLQSQLAFNRVPAAATIKVHVDGLEASEINILAVVDSLEPIGFRTALNVAHKHARKVP
ncbi:hypothetical protein APED_33240 [Acanthopleuribacter pedis]